MSWIERLSRTYECASVGAVPLADRPWPIAHMVKKAHIEVRIDESGNLKGMRPLARVESPTLIPVSEFSSARTSDPIPHPLCEELSYCAADLPDADTEKNRAFLAGLDTWCQSDFSHPKVRAIAVYLAKNSLWHDLTEKQVLPVLVEDAKGKKTKVMDAKVFIRWSVESVGDPCSGTWQDQSLIDAWIAFDRSRATADGICMVTGATTRIAKKHPRFVRHPGDGAKLISANDNDGYTFRGRFTDGDKDYGRQTCSVGYEASQQAHGALRWLIARQGYRHGDDEQVVVSWAVSGAPVPDPFADTFELLGFQSESTPFASLATDTAQAFAIRLKKAISGYGARLQPTEDIVVMGLDSATPGRMAITYYRELRGSEFLERIEAWHSKCAWPQDFGKDRKFVGAPAPHDIADAAYGRRLDDKLRKATVERLLPCIIDGLPVPIDLVRSCVRRTINRVGLDRWEWEKCLGIACALFKGHYIERSYQMTLEPDRMTRDYLYGRLLAIADSIEGYALFLTDEAKKRDTTAARLMQRFADHPFSTWRTIELALVPYRSRLQAGSEKSAAFLAKRTRLLDEVMTTLNGIKDRVSDAALSGEFLLGFHSQRQEFRGGGPPSPEGDGAPNDKISDESNDQT